jgi:hypothetical protein
MPAVPYRDPSAASQQKAKIGTGEHLTHSRFRQSIDPDSMPAGTHPCAEWISAAAEREEVAERNVGRKWERGAGKHLAG